MGEVSKQQEQDGRLAEALRNLAGDFDKIGDLEIAKMKDDTPIMWPAENIKEVLYRAADRLEELTLAHPAPGSQE